MAAPAGNEFWKMRAKHGRDKLFETPQLLWEAACEYFKYIDDNPYEKTQWDNRNREEVTIHIRKPYSWSGLCFYLKCNEQYFRNFKRQNKQEDFSAVIHDIEQIIYSQQFEGATVGVYNANIIARALGLKEHMDFSGTVGTKQIEDETEEELQKRLEELARKNVEGE